MRTATIKQLRAVANISRLGKIVSAAKALHLSAPAVTQQLQQLEAEVGFALFDRTSDGLRATDAGRIVVETAEQVIAEITACEDRLAALKGLKAGRVAVGVVSTAKYFAPHLIAAFAKATPGLEISLRVGNRDDISDDLRDYAIDIAIMGTPPRNLAVDAIRFGDHPLLIVAPPTHRLAGRPRIARKELAGERFLTREEGSGTRTSMEAYLEGLPRALPNLRLEMGSNETIKQAVMAGLGIAFISAHTVAEELKSGRLVTLAAAGLPVLRHWYGVRRSDKALTPSVQAFSEYLLAQGASFLPIWRLDRSARR